MHNSSLTRRVAAVLRLLVSARIPKMKKMISPICFNTRVLDASRLNLPVHARKPLPSHIKVCFSCKTLTKDPNTWQMAAMGKIKN